MTRGRIHTHSHATGLSSRIAVGVIVKAFGIRGDLIIQPMTDNPARFKSLKRVFVGATETIAVETTVADVSVNERGVRLKLGLAHNRTQAEQLIGRLLFVNQADAIRLPKGAHFIHELVGMQVVDENGIAIGVLNDVLKYPAHDVYVVDADGEELLIPVVRQFIKQIDAQRRIIRVHFIEGMRGMSQSKPDEHDAD